MVLKVQKVEDFLDQNTFIFYLILNYLFYCGKKTYLMQP